jgi:Lhr-like helicase
MTNNNEQQWYIVQQSDNTCEIIEAQEKPPNVTSWGGYETQEKAIAKRIGLIRAGKCQPK